MTHLSNVLRDKHENDRISAEAATAGREDLMEGMIAACALIAHADGFVDAKERRRVMQIMRLLPMFVGFSTHEVAEEFALHERAFEHDPSGARTKALETVAAFSMHPGYVGLLLSACQKVLEADGVQHPAEYQALHEIGRVLGAPKTGCLNHDTGGAMRPE